MTSPTLEERVAAVEAELARLKQERHTPARKALVGTNPWHI